ncbi:universal stress protein [Bermanella marisrubri]|uniref:Universal stress protein family protein n=1 Tax=Bermanella marisrubri TaxID=207949 RepID=Q1MXY7_9GAMM|nr:universal stress protein [Bermanella marisrubri]EAT10842.1 universal stress protein family protein [Oceanobacter sp. RED65] [Bermanella marisrubri]QIZ84224.1 universal stress protein [Bermanella marisrubri]
MINRILFATDLGIYNPYLMSQLSVLAHSTGARVDLVHAIEPMGVFAESILSIYMTPDDQKHLRNSGMPQVMEHIRQQVLDSLKVEIDEMPNKFTISDVIVEIGPPSDIIIKHARQCRSDLIVIGSHSGQGDGEAMIGSVAGKVLRKASVPVYFLPTACLREGL